MSGAGTISVANNQTLTYNGTIASAALTVLGPGTFALGGGISGGGNSFSGGLIVNNGATCKAREVASGSAFGTGAATLTNGTLLLMGTGTTGVGAAWSLTLGGNGN